LFVQSESTDTILLFGRGTIDAVPDQPCIERRAWPGSKQIDRRRVSDELELNSPPVRHRAQRDPPIEQVLIQTRRGMALLDVETLAVHDLDLGGGWLTPCSVDDGFDWDGDGVDDMIVHRRSMGSLEPLSMPSARLWIVSGKSLEMIDEIAKGAQSGMGTVLNGVPLVVFTTNAGICTAAPGDAEVLQPGTGGARTIPFVWSHRSSRGDKESIDLAVDRWKDVPPTSGLVTDSVELWRLSQRR
jgi:hypothetical protein